MVSISFRRAVGIIQFVGGIVSLVFAALANMVKNVDRDHNLPIENQLFENITKVIEGSYEISFYLIETSIMVISIALLVFGIFLILQGLVNIQDK